MVEITLALYKNSIYCFENIKFLGKIDKISVDTQKLFKNIISEKGLFMCKNEINQSYIESQLKHNDIFFLLFDLSKFKMEKMIDVLKTKDSRSFILGKYLGLNEYFIDILCSRPGYGKIILTNFISFCETLGAKSIILNSLPLVMTFYPKFGFEFRKNCRSLTNIISLPKNIKNRKIFPKTIQELYDDDDYEEFINLLIKNEFSLDCNRKTNKYTKNELKEHECGQIKGFRMVKCLDDKKKKTQSISLDDKKKKTQSISLDDKKKKPKIIQQSKNNNKKCPNSHPKYCKNWTTKSNKCIKKDLDCGDSYYQFKQTTFEPTKKCVDSNHKEYGLGDNCLKNK